MSAKTELTVFIGLTGTNCLNAMLDIIPISQLGITLLASTPMKLRSSDITNETLETLSERKVYDRYASCPEFGAQARHQLMSCVTSILHSCAEIYRDWNVTQCSIHADDYFAQFGCCIKH